MNGKKILALVLAIAMLAGTAGTLIAGLRGNKANAGTQGYDFSAGLDKNGYFKGVKATDYITLPDYKSFTMPESLTKVSAEEVNQQIEYMLDTFATEEKDMDASKVSAMGDTVNIDYVGSVDGVEFIGGNTQGNGSQITIGSGTLIGATEECQGFEEQLVGHKVGDTFDITVQFPEGYNASKDADGNEVVLSGRIAKFTITLNSFYKTIVPELTDEFVAENLSGYYTDVADLKDKVEKQLIDNQMKNYVWSKLVDGIEIKDYPQAITDFENNYSLNMVAANASYYNMTAEDFLTALGFESTDDYLASIEEDVKETVEMYTMVQAICEQEGIKASNSDVKEYFQRVYGTDDTTQYEATYGTNYLRNFVLNDKLLNHLVANMEVVAD